MLCTLTKETKDAQDEETEKSLNALGRQNQGMRLIEAVVDSGAVNSVAPPDIFDGLLKPSLMSKGGKKYRGPDGSRIPNLGQMDVAFESEEGHRCGLTWQIADVERPLVAVSHLSAAGNRVILEKDGGEVVHEETGRKIKLQKKGGVYVMRLWVAPRKKTSESDSKEASGFPRLGRS
jgi:hypothetical protein